ncbi:MAG: DUF362 domain-containing protein [Sphaerochaetaceae bacterium]
MKTKAVVAIQRCDTYQKEELDAAMSVVCQHAHMPSVQGKRVLLKPNILSDAHPDKALTTRAEVLGSLIRYLTKEGAKEVLVGDSPGISGPNFTAKHSGIAQVCDQEGATWCDFNASYRMHSIPNVKNLQLPLPLILDEVDLVFSVAKMKTHQLMYATGAVKNLFGLVIGLHKSACHLKFPTRHSFARMLGGLYERIQPDWALMDAVVAMEGPGPAAGLPRHMGLLLSSNDLTALDAAQALIMGYNPHDIPLLKELLAKKLTLWDSLEEISYPLLHANDLVCSDYKRIEISRKRELLNLPIPLPFVRSMGLRKQKKEPKPLFDPLVCIGCGKCVEICPSHALHLDKHHKVVADYKACIRCYCCHEVCPVDAITIGKREA